MKLSDPHHLPMPDKAFGRKVTDHATVPLCRGPGTQHHHALAQDNPDWWAIHAAALWRAAFIIHHAFRCSEEREVPL